MTQEKCDLSVSSIQDIISYQANLLNGFKTELNGNYTAYTAIGALCSNRSEWFSTYYSYFNVPLKDLNNPQKIIYLSIPKDVADLCNLKGYEYISVTGYLTIITLKEKLETRFKVLNISIINKNNYTLIESNKVFSSFFKSIDLKRNNFPFYQQLSIAAIVPQTGSSFDEFSKQVELINNIRLERIPTNIQSKDLIIKTINNVMSTQYNVLVIIRGGGNQEVLDIFDDPDICELVAKFNGYKLIGIGHSRDHSLLDLVVDYSADTPTDAGAYINNITKNLESFRKEFINDAQFSFQQKLSDAELKNNILSKKIRNSQRIIIAIITFILAIGYYIYSTRHAPQTQTNATNATQEIKQESASKPIDTNNTKKHRHK